MWGSPSKIRETPEWQSLCVIACCYQDQALKKDSPCRIHYCTLQSEDPLAGAGEFLGIAAPWHGRQAGKKPGSLACDIDLLSSKRVNEIHTSCKMPQVGSIGLFLVKTISSESLPLLQNHLFLSTLVLFEKQPRLSCSERLFRFPGIDRTLVPLNQAGRGK